MNLPSCPKCNSEYTYEDRGNIVCSMCAYEWNEQEKDQELVTLDANGNKLIDGDTVSVIKDLKVKGSSKQLKVGTKIRNIRIVPGDKQGGHNLEARIDGFGVMKVTSAFVKKVK